MTDSLTTQQLSQQLQLEQSRRKSKDVIVKNLTKSQITELKSTVDRLTKENTELKIKSQNSEEFIQTTFEKLREEISKTKKENRRLEEENSMLLQCKHINETQSRFVTV